ncbi:MAG: helix-turn-helix domain-containing protein, partial [Solirubrobacteraceae bacterium]
CDPGAWSIRVSWLCAESLFHGSLIELGDVRCCAPKSGAGAEECAQVTQLLVVRRGVFVVHRRGRSGAADANTAVLLRAGEVYRVSHPAAGGDRCIVLVIRRQDLAEEVLQRAGASATISSGAQLAARLLAATAKRQTADALEVEESAIGVLLAVAGELGSSTGTVSRPTAAQERRIGQLRVVLASAPEVRWTLAGLGRVVNCSPFHLARQFRAGTGESIGRYLTRLRLALALERLAAGESDLARLAVDVGFAGHSHFTASCRAAYGFVPTELRDRLTRPTFIN